MTSIQDTVAKAIAWRDLTDKGRKQCVWPDEFADSELKEYRGIAATAIGVFLKAAAKQGSYMMPNRVTKEMVEASANEPSMQAVDSAVILAAVHGFELSCTDWEDSPIAKGYIAMQKVSTELKWREG